MKAILNFQSATKKTNLVEDHPFIIPTMLQFLSDKKIFKVSTNQNTLLALAISDLLQNNKSGIEPSKEHSYNAKKINLSSSFSHKGLSMKFPQGPMVK